MSDFDPTKPAILHDSTKDRTFEWNPTWAERYRRGAKDVGNGVVLWENLRLDGWREPGEILQFKRPLNFGP